MNHLLTLLPTNLLYQQPDPSAYDGAKEDFIKAQLGSSPDPVSLWTTLMDSFAQKLPTQSQRFSEFKLNRLSSSQDSRYVLKVDQALEYFKHFYFLYFNIEPHYTLSASEKAALLNNVLEGMDPQICEPGKVTHFEQSIQTAKKDEGWILNELSKHRANLIQKIADEYNTENAVDVGYSIHTKMQMSKVATQRKLGIDPVTKIDDPYLFYLDTTKMTDYFDRVAPQKFAEYEQKASSNLAQHVLLEVTGWLRLNEISIDSWDKSGLQLTNAQQTHFTQGLNSFFSPAAFGKLCEYNENYDNDADDAFAEYCLLSKDAFYRGLQELVQQKLIDDGLFLEVGAAPIPSESLKNVRWAPGLNTQNCLQFFQSFNTRDSAQTPGYWAQFIIKHQAIFLGYPTLLLSDLIQKPELWKNCPKSLKNNVNLVDALLKDLTERLLASLSGADEPIDQNALIDLVCMITQSNTEYFKTFPDKLLSDKAIALKFLAKDGLIFKYLPEALKADQDVYQMAVNQNRKAGLDAMPTDEFYLHCQELLFSVEHDNDVLSDDELLAGNDSSPLLVDILENVLVLLKEPHISTGRLVRLAQQLTPKLLLDINTSRLKRKLFSLPHCDSNRLLEFSQGVESQNWSLDGYLQQKRDWTSSRRDLNSALFLTTDYKNDLAKQCLIESNQWFMGFIAYQKKLPSYSSAFKTWDDFVAQWRINLKSAQAFFLSIWHVLRDDVSKLMITLALFVAVAAIAQFMDSMASYLFLNLGLAYPFVLMASLALSALFTVLCYKDNPRFVMIPLWDKFSFLFFSIACMIIYPEVYILVSLYIAASLVATAGLKLYGQLRGDPMSLGDVARLVSAGVKYFLESHERLVVQFTDQFIVFFHNAKTIAIEWPGLFVASSVPWIKRSWLSLFSKNHLSPEDALMRDAEESIVRLLNSDEPSAVQKGELLQCLWDEINSELHSSTTSITPQHLAKPYSISGQSKALSFWDVTTAKRANSVTFDATVPDQRRSFFGLRGKTTTENQLQKYKPEEYNAPPSSRGASDERALYLAPC